MSHIEICQDHPRETANTYDESGYWGGDLHCEHPHCQWVYRPASAMTSPDLSVWLMAPDGKLTEG